MRQTSKAASFRWVRNGLGLGALTYGAYVGATWAGYGRRSRADTEDGDMLLHRFMPDYEVSDRYQRRVQAPADVTFDAACTSELGQSPIVQALFKMREAVFGRPSSEVVASGGLVEEIKAFGWGVLAEVPGREIVFGAATRPWTSDVTFRAIAADDFASFCEPGYVKIIWMLRADPAGAGQSVVRTETRVSTTDSQARARFRWYWSFLSPGIKIIRLVMLAQVKTAAEGRAATAARALSAAH